MRNLFRIFGYEITPISKKYPEDMDREFEEIYNECKKYTLTSIERMYALYKSIEYIVNSKIPGDFVECGVWKGGSSMLIARTLQKMNEVDRKIYLYDTFAGMSKPTEKDIRISDSLPVIKIWEKMENNNYNSWEFSPINEVEKNMHSTEYPKKDIIFIKGKVEDTIPRTMPPQIALLRLDTDWYESTYHELNYLYPLLSENGVLIIDDYGHYAGAKEAVDKFFKENSIPILLNRIDYTGRMGIKISQ